jgi:hypothetical protein
MSIIDTRAGAAISRTAVVTALAAGAIGLAGPALADEKLITEKYIATEECAVVGAGQICPVNTDYWPTKTQFLARPPAIKVEFTANQNHCADMIAHVWIAGPGYNGAEWGSNIVRPGQSDGGYDQSTTVGCIRSEFRPRASRAAAIQAPSVRGAACSGSGN